MLILSPKETASNLAKLTGFPVLFVYFGHIKEDGMTDILLAAPYLLMPDLFNLLEGVALIQCDSLEEATTLFHQTVGDKGSTRSNPYNGPVAVYAAIFGADGQMLDENS